MAKMTCQCFLLGAISKTDEQFKTGADDNFEVETPLELVAEVYNNEPITDDIIKGINSERDTERAKEELREIVS